MYSLIYTSLPYYSKTPHLSAERMGRFTIKHGCVLQITMKARLTDAGYLINRPRSAEQPTKVIYLGNEG